jgi:methyl-accepting chemotaxis protein
MQDNIKNPENIRQIIRRTRTNIFLLIFLINFFLLFSSEFIASLFNYKLDTQGADFLQRVIFTFKPTVILMFFVSCTLILMVVYLILVPLFRFLRDGTGYEKARKVIITMPWILLFVSEFFWFFGTTGYFILKNWNGDSGIPYMWVMFMKLGTGFLASVFSAVIIHVITNPLKERLNIYEMTPKDNDIFIRYNDYLILMSSLFYAGTHLGYVAYHFFLSKENSGGFTYFMLGFLGIMLFLFIECIVLMTVARRIFRHQVDFLNNKIKEFSSGKADLTKRILLLNFDELGELSDSFNKFMEYLSKDFLELKDQVMKMRGDIQVLTDSSGDLASGAEKQAASTAEISNSMDDFNRIMQEIRSNIQIHSDVINRNAQNAKQLSQNLMTVIETSKIVRFRSNENLESVRTGIETVNHSVDKTLKMGGNLQEIAHRIETAGQETDRIDEILGSIQDIAESTNMLAMNASIEAAHAGDAGKGFAIVANEIRTLAETSSAAVRDISQLVISIKQRVNEAVVMAKAGAVEAEETKNLANSAGSALNTIFEDMKKSTDMIVEISELTEQQGTSIKGIRQASEQLEDISDKIRTSMDLQADGATGIGQSISTLSGSITENAGYAEKLAELAQNLQAMSERISDLIRLFVIE